MRAALTGPARIPVGLWSWIGVASFGGPAAQIALLHREIVERRGWVGESQFQRALSLCMLLPGPEALQLVIFLGWRLNGRRGGLVAGACFLLPAIVLLLALSLLYAFGARVPGVAGLFFGLAATVVALIGHALVRLARRALDTPLQWAIALLAFAALALTALPYPWLMVASAGAGWLAGPRRAAPLPADGLRRAPRAWLAPLAGGLVAWLAPLAALAITGVRGVPLRLYLFLSKAALLTFGGAYAIVKYVSDDLVRAQHLITAPQAVAGLALAETTPGPLMIVLQFFGFAAGWNDGSLGSPAGTAVVCALLASWASFLPSFVLVLVAAPYVDRIATLPALAAALRGITAFVVGVIASLALTVALTVLVLPTTGAPDGAAIAIAAGAALLLARRVPLHWVLAGGALAGVLVRLPGFGALS